jgi:hypothetical protein
MDPIVRQLIVCQDWETYHANRNQLSALGIVSNIVASKNTTFPAYCSGLCVLAFLTDIHREGDVALECVEEATGEVVFQGGPVHVVCPADPLRVVGYPFRSDPFTFPGPGVYLVRLSFDGRQIGESSFRAR